MNKLRYILLSASLMIATALSAQNITVKGVIKDASNGDPVPFASIRVDGTMTGGMSDMDGVYSISVQKNGTLIFSSIGYKDLSVPKATTMVSSIISVSGANSTLISALPLTGTDRSL